MASKAKVVTVWPFAEKVWLPLLYPLVLPYFFFIAFVSSVVTLLDSMFMFPLYCLSLPITGMKALGAEAALVPSRVPSMWAHA